MKPRLAKPLVGVICDTQFIGNHVYHFAGDKYIRALSRAADVVPVLIPSLFDDQDIEQWCSRLDGLFLTGAHSMLDPIHYGEPRPDGDYFYDERRDSLSFRLIRCAIAQQIPLFAVCRGLQDINVALGGSLHQAVHDIDGMMDHREDERADVDTQYGPAHDVQLNAGGLLHAIIGQDCIRINSLHHQGIKKLGQGLSIEASAADGLIEAIRIEALDFGLAVQWHPEWNVLNNSEQLLIYKAFSSACLAKMGA